jgi:hypothetical protein
MYQAKHAESSILVRRSACAGPTQVPRNAGDHQNPKGGLPCPRPVLRLCPALLLLADAQEKPHVAAVERPGGNQVKSSHIILFKLF